MLANLNYCNFRKPVVDLIEFCSSPEPDTLEIIEGMSTAKLLAEVWNPKLTKPRLTASKTEAENQTGIASGVPSDSTSYRPEPGTEVFDGDESGLVDQPKCSWQSVGTDLLKNIFLIIGKIGSITAQIINFTSISPDKLHNECLEFGEDIGIFLRVALNFKPRK